MARHQVELSSAGIQRTTTGDLLALATDSVAAPMQVAAVLLLDRVIDVDAVRTAVVRRSPAVPRLRQRLRSTPFGGGRPIWVDDPGFSAARHVHAVRCPAPGDEATMLAVAAGLATGRLPRDRPLWSISVINGLAADRTALVLVLHHVVADGLGGLAVLAQLLDGNPAISDNAFPATAPTNRELRVDALRSRLHALTRLPAGCRLITAAAAELRLGRVRRPGRTSLNQRTGRRRQLAVARAELAGLAAAAHRHGVTVNDLLLAAVGGALEALLRERGEVTGSVVVSVPVSARSAAAATALGNKVGAMLVEIPAGRDPAARLANVAAATHRRVRVAGRGASAALLGPVFRVLAGVGAFRWFVDRQRLITTLLTDLPGPPDRLTFLGADVVEIVPITAITGNVTVAFAALSYAGSMVVTMIADPDHCADLPVLVSALQRELCTVTAPAQVGT